MTIGLSKEEIISKLYENKELLSDDISESLFAKIAEVITENNKKIEQQIPEVVTKALEDEIAQSES